MTEQSLAVLATGTDEWNNFNNLLIIMHNLSQRITLLFTSFLVSSSQFYALLSLSLLVLVLSVLSTCVFLCGCLVTYLEVVFEIIIIIVIVILSLLLMIISI